MKTAYAKRFATLLTALSCVIWTPGSHALSILLGSDYFTTPGDGSTNVNFAGLGVPVLAPLGVVGFQGRPIGPGATDTIVERQEDAILPGVGSSDTIPIELVALSLESIDPVVIMGTPGRLFVSLTPGQATVGTMTINHENPDDGGPLAEGTFSSTFFDVFFDLTLETTGGPNFLGSFNFGEPLNGNGFWSHESQPEDLLVSGPAGDQEANSHTNPPTGFGDFFLAGFDLGGAPVERLIVESTPSGNENHVPIPPTQVPAPAGLWLLMTGLGLGAVLKRRYPAQS